MIKATLFAGSALLAIATCAIAGPTPAAAELKIANTHLVATCRDGKPTTAGERSWKVSEPVTLTVTMRNDPRSGIGNTAPGFATIAFSPEPGHHYEVEVRASALANSQRVWPKGGWTAVVRDRTTDQVVSGDPQWVESGCPVRP